MLDPILFVAFLTTTLFIIVTPGPSVAFASAQAVKFGPRAALQAVAGDALGSVVHIIIAVGSLKALMALSDIVLPFLQIVGGIFILYLAVQSFRDAKSGHNMTSAKGSKATFWAGFFACVTNPKAIVFFVALFPGFISAEHPVLVQTLIYGAIFIVLDAASIIGYALLAMHTFRKTVAGRINVDTLSGMGLAGVGVFLIIKGYRAIPSA